VKYCSRCLLPDTKPYIIFDAKGVCSACRAHEKKNSAAEGIDWGSRRRDFERLVVASRKTRAPLYDVLVPVSGGKDSISQVHRLLGRGLRILAVNVDYGIKTEIGHHNLACISQMGANLIVYTPDAKTHRKLIRLGFEKYGDPDLLSHCLLHAYPLRVALSMKIPLVLLGENSAFEYSGETSTAAGQMISRDWFERYAANDGNTPEVIARRHGIPGKDLVAYDFPDEFHAGKTRAVFCSHYFHWDSVENLKIARRYGFRALPKVGEGSFRNYVGIDEKINRIHQYMKLLKFGYGRATDHACEDIRNHRITRAKGIRLVKRYDRVPLSDYYVDDFIRFIGISKKKFQDTLRKYTNHRIWEWTRSGLIRKGDDLC